MSPIATQKKRREARLRARKAAGECEVRWADIIWLSVCAPNVDHASASRNTKALVLDILRRARSFENARGEAHDDQRKQSCNMLRKLTKRFCLTDIGAYIEHTGWLSPQSVR